LEIPRIASAGTGVVCSMPLCRANSFAVSMYKRECVHAERSGYLLTRSVPRLVHYYCNAPARSCRMPVTYARPWGRVRTSIHLSRPKKKKTTHPADCASWAKSTWLLTHIFKYCHAKLPIYWNLGFYVNGSSTDDTSIIWTITRLDWRDSHNVHFRNSVLSIAWRKINAFLFSSIT
jgi:hypothetical protein